MMKRKVESDIKVGNNLIELKMGISSVRNLRAGLVQTAFHLIEAPLNEKRSLLLIEPKITEETLKKEWESIYRILHSKIFDRMHLIIFKNDRFISFPNTLDPAFYSELKQLILINKKPESKRRRIYRGNSYFIIVKILIHQWLLNKGPMTVKWLAESSGFSYPTVASILRDLGNLIERKSDRRIMLSQFPHEEFNKLLIFPEFNRSAKYYIDFSNQPFSVEFYLRRLEKMNLPMLAIGGILGAKHYSSGLDIVGTPRLDLSLHDPDNVLNDDFIEKLDPALKPIFSLDVPAKVAVHFIQQKKNFFIPREGGLFWADPVECLLDLHELHLEAQAKQFLNEFQSRWKAKVNNAN
ncbi:MAG: MarR family transcriptional regulator [Tissierellales bacterium]|nr:MarR family transcriptional regulator [Tissierellales bacterium]